MFRAVSRQSSGAYKAVCAALGIFMRSCCLLLVPSTTEISTICVVMIGYNRCKASYKIDCFLLLSLSDHVTLKTEAACFTETS